MDECITVPDRGTPPEPAERAGRGRKRFVEFGLGVILTAAFVTGFWAGARAQTTNPEAERDEINARLDDMEEVLINLEERVGSRALASAFDATKLDIGGFFNTAVTHVDGEDDTATSFNRQVFEILIKAELGDDWSAFFAQAFLRQSAVIFTDPEGRRSPSFNSVNPGVDTDTVLAWVNYRVSDTLNIQFGRFLTPHGIINIEHFPATLLDQEQPLFLRPFGGQTIFQNFTNGIQAYGTTFAGARGQHVLGYHAFVGSFAGNTEDLVGGGRLFYGYSPMGVTVGANASFGDREKGVNSDFFVYGFDLLLDRGPILWKSEIFITDEDQGEDRLGFYTQPAWRINAHWTVFYRFDYLDDGVTDGDTREHMAGVVFDPIPNARLRVTYARREFEEGLTASSADADIYQFSATFSF